MKKTYNVLITAAGSILGQGIIKCLKHINSSENSSINYKIFSIDMSPLASGLYRTEKAFLVPPFSSPDYFDAIIKICRENQINAVFIGSDEELHVLTKNKEEIKEKTGAVVITNSLHVIDTCFDKWKTVRFLSDNNLPVTNSCIPENIDSFVKDFDFPLVVKPRIGHGSINFHVVQNYDEMNNAIIKIKNSGGLPIIQEFIKGEDNEFTTGVVTDKSGTKVLSSITIKKTIRNGQTYKAFIEKFDEVTKSAEKIALKLGSIGPINIQSKLDKGVPKVFEINPRFSATVPMRAVAGINEPDIAFRNQVLSKDIVTEKYTELLCIRYLNEMYVSKKDYDKFKAEKKIEQPQSFVASYF